MEEDIRIKSGGRQNGKTLENVVTFLNYLDELESNKMYGISKCGNITLLTKTEVIPKSKVKEKIEELDIRIGECCENIDKTVDEERAYWKKEKRDAIMQRFILQELLED